LNYAIKLAKQIGAEIKAVYVRPTPPLFGRMTPIYSEKLSKDETFLGLAKKKATNN